MLIDKIVCLYLNCMKIYGVLIGYKIKEKIFNLYLIIFIVEKYKVFRSIGFQEEIGRYGKEINDRIDKIEEKLIDNPKYGNPLGTEWFRESRFENYRIYYLIYEDFKAIYLVALSGKKDQQQTINTIKLFLEFFKEEIKKSMHHHTLKGVV